MKVLVTGGSGRLGPWVLRELVTHGYQVINADRTPHDAEPGVPFRQLELTDVGQVAGALAGCDAMIHLAAIPVPDRHADEVVFGNNVRSTFAALQAAALLGVNTVIVASSTAALGRAFARRPFAPHYFPIDEAHPLLPQDPYALSKEVTERTGEAFHRSAGMTVLAYRFHYIAQPGTLQGRVLELAKQPDLGARELWGYIDARDAATACRLGLESSGLGFEAFNIVASDALSHEPVHQLIERFYPGVTCRVPAGELTGFWSNDKARRLLGFVPRHGWRDPSNP